MSRSDIVVKPQDLTYLSWDECTSPSGMTGVCAKAREGRGVNAVYYKRSHVSAFGYGYRDLLVELIGSRLAEILGLDHVSFQLVHARLQPDGPLMWVVKSKSYRKSGERAVGLADYMELGANPQETPLEFLCRSGWTRQAAQIVFFDYLTATRDRDISTFEVLLDVKGAARLSPIASCSMSLVNAYPLGLWRREPLAHLSSGAFLSFESQADSLGFAAKTLGPVPKPRALKRCLVGNLGDHFDDLSFLEGCFEIINERWDAYARFCRL